MTVEISGQNYVTISKVIPMVSCILKQFDLFTPTYDIGIKMETILIREFEKRFANIEKSFLLAVSTVLDPRFKNIHFKDALALSSIMKYIQNELEIHSLNDSNSDSSDMSDGLGGELQFDLWAHHKKLAYTKKSKPSQSGRKIDEVAQYFSVPVRNLKEDPIHLWDEMKCIYPLLHKVAEKYFHIVATSVPSERLFSKAGATATKIRYRLTGKRLSKLLFLSSLPENLHLF